MAAGALVPLLAVLGLGAAGGFSERTGELKEQQRVKDFDAFSAVMKAAAAAGETDFFGQETQKSYKRLGGDEGSFNAFRQIAGAELTQEQRSAAFAAVMEEREQARTKGALAGAQREAIEEGGLEGLGREERIALATAPQQTAAAGLQARGAAVQERTVAVQEQELPIKKRLADLKDTELKLQDRLGTGELAVRNRLARVQEQHNKLVGQQLRGNIANDLTLKGGFPSGEATVLADHILGNKIITDEKLLAKLPIARQSLEATTSVLAQSFNRMKEANDIIDKTQRPGKGIVVSAADKASNLATANTMMIESLQQRSQVEQLDDPTKNRFIMNNLRFMTEKGEIVTLNEAAARDIDFSELSPRPREFGISETEISSSSGVKEAVERSRERERREKASRTPGSGITPGP